MNAPDGEDVPARLDAAVEALDAHALHVCADLMHFLANELRRSSPETRVAVAAALARPIEVGRG